jgi:hypothetical protein
MYEGINHYSVPGYFNLLLDKIKSCALSKQMRGTVPQQVIKQKKIVDVIVLS